MSIRARHVVDWEALFIWLGALLFCIAAWGAAIVWVAERAHAHEQWADGSAIPAWVKASCCGPADAHLLSPGDYTQFEQDGHLFWRVTIEGRQPFIIPDGQALPSQDGHAWLFANNSSQTVYCFFVPMSI